MQDKGREEGGTKRKADRQPHLHVMEKETTHDRGDGDEGGKSTGEKIAKEGMNKESRLDMVSIFG